MLGWDPAGSNTHEFGERQGEGDDIDKLGLSMLGLHGDVSSKGYKEGRLASCLSGTQSFSCSRPERINPCPVPVEQDLK